MSHNQRYHIYGLKDGKLIHVDDVPNGNACGCICNKCNEKLQARNQGEVLDSYFAHQKDSNCGGETEAHKQAKDVIKKHKYLFIPDLNGIKKRIDFDRVEVEKNIKGSKYRADLICMTGKSSLIVEIVVTSPINNEKEKFIKENGINTLLIHITLTDPNHIPDTFEINVLQGFNRHWFNNEELNKFEKEREEISDRLEELQENLNYWENSCDYKKELPDSKKIEMAEIIIEIKKCKGRLEEIDGYRDWQFNFMDHWVG